jgi:hypothetical protein
MNLTERAQKIYELTQETNQAHKNAVAYSYLPSKKSCYNECMQRKEQLIEELKELVYGGQNE